MQFPTAPFPSLQAQAIETALNLRPWFKPGLIPELDLPTFTTLQRKQFLHLQHIFAREINMANGKKRWGLCSKFLKNTKDAKNWEVSLRVFLADPHHPVSPYMMYCGLISKINEKSEVEVEKDPEIIKWLSEIDFEANVAVIQQRAESFERDCEAWLTSLGITFKTQAQLKAEGSSATPDFLLDQPLEIKDHLGQSFAIRWLEFKSGMGIARGITYQLAEKQAKRYFQEWGVGAVMFGLGLVEGFKFDGPEEIAILDGSFLMGLANEEEKEDVKVSSGSETESWDEGITYNPITENLN